MAKPNDKGSRGKSNHDSSKKGKNAKSLTTKKSFYTKHKKEITFDEDARKEFLTGFSERKRQRRAFGLAMQKVKDRQAKLEERKEAKDALLERVEEAEQAKEVLVQQRLDKRPTGEPDEIDPAIAAAKTITYQDDQTQQQWGGQVIVTTTMVLQNDDDDDDDDDVPPSSKKHQTQTDQDQRYAGNVHHFLGKLKNKLPAKSKSAHATKFKGKHGAANMKGMGGAANLNMAQKILNKFSSKGTEGKSKGKGKKGRK
jgi:ribosomal RNA-processing protein 17